MIEPYDYHLNFEALKKSATKLEAFLNKYRRDNDDIEYIYQGLKPLFDKIHSNQLKEAIKENLVYGRFMSDTGLDDQYPDLSQAYSVFYLDIQGFTDNPNNENFKKMYYEIKAEILAEKAAQEKQ